MTENEKTVKHAIAKGKADPRPLSSLGVDQRVNKAFDPGLGGAASKVIASDATGSFAGGSAFIDEASHGRGPAAVVGDPAAPAASIVTPGVSANQLHMRLVEQDLNAGAASAADVTTGERYLTQDEALLAYQAGLAASIASDAPSVNAMNLRRIEGDLDVSASAFEDAGSVNAMNLRRIEGDLDTSSVSISANDDPSLWTPADPAADELNAHQPSVGSADPANARDLDSLPDWY